MSEKVENKRSRIFLLKVWPEKYEEIEEALKSYEFLGIEHNQDVWTADDVEADKMKPEEKQRGIKKGELKKKHRHYVIRFKNPRYLASVMKEFTQYEIPYQDIEAARNLDNSLMYLVHYGCEDKHNYNLSDVFGSPALKRQLERCLNKSSQSVEEQLVSIIEMIDGHEIGHYIRLDEMLHICIDCGYLDTYKMYYNLIRDIIREHNLKGKSFEKVFTKDDEETIMNIERDIEAF